MPVATSPAPQRRLLGIGLRVLAMAGFAIMAAAIKLASDWGAGVVEIMFWRFAFGAVPLVAYLAYRSRFDAYRTRHLPAHLRRGVIGLASMYLSFEAIRRLPLAEATTMSFAAPLIAVALSALLLKERVGPRRWTAVLLGLVGVGIVMQPGGSPLPPAGVLFAFGGACGVAAVTIAIRRLGVTEAAETTVFWFTALSLAVLAVPMILTAGANDARTWAALIVTGLFGGIAQLAMTASLRFAPVGAVTPFDYSQLIWATLLGWLLWDRLPAPATWAGGALIVACGLYALYRERVLARFSAR